MSRVIGIDLGTTNSCVAVVDNGQPAVIPNTGGYKTTPSMVAVTEAGKRLVGHIAKRQAITHAENTVFAAKRLIGRKWNSPPVVAAKESAESRARLSRPTKMRWPPLLQTNQGSRQRAPPCSTPRERRAGPRA